MTSPDLEDSKEAAAYHEAGHALFHLLLRGAFEDDAILESNRFIPGSASLDCHLNTSVSQQFLGGVCNEGYCLHEMWEYLAGPVTEWSYRHRKGLTSRDLFSWATSLSEESNAATSNIHRDDLTNALHCYCQGCLMELNTPTPSGDSHSNAHAIPMLAIESDEVRSIVDCYWSWIERVANALLASAECRLPGGTLTALLQCIPKLSESALEDSRRRREHDDDACRASASSDR